MASVLEYQDRSVEQGHYNRSTPALQLPSEEAVQRVAPTHAVEFPKLKFVIGSTVRCGKTVDMFHL